MEMYSIEKCVYTLFYILIAVYLIGISPSVGFDSDIDNESDYPVYLNNDKHRINSTTRARHRRSDLRRRRGVGKLSRMQLSKWKYTKGEIKSLFEKYYDCVEKSLKPEKREKEAVSALLAIEGQRVKLKCPTCYRPDQTDEQAKVFWQVIRNEDSSVSFISSKTPGFKVKRDMTLVIKQVDVDDVGHYYCVKGEDAEVIYQLDVLMQEPQKVIRNVSELQTAKKLVDHNLEVFTDWSVWTECNVCGPKGTRKRFGTCMVKKMDIDKPSRPVDMPVMVLYPGGVPCRSTVLPRKLTHLPGIGNRRSEILIEKCNEKCVLVPPQSENRQLAHLPFMSMTPRPSDPPAASLKMVERSVLYMDAGAPLILTCPTERMNKVRWQRGDIPIRTHTIRRLTRGRVFVDALNRLRIKRLSLRDSAPYNCWVTHTHVATMKVIVTEPIDVNLKNYVTYGGLVITVLSLFMFCVCKLCVGRPKRK